MGRQFHDCRARCLEGLAVEVDQAGVAHERFYAQGACKAGCPGGGQGVIRPSEVIASGFRGVLSHENRAGLLDVFGEGCWFLHQQLQMLRSKAIRELGGLLQRIAEHHQAPIANRGFRHLAPGVILQLRGNRFGDLLCQPWARGQQDRCRQGVVLSLGQQIRRHQLG